MVDMANRVWNLHSVILMLSGLYTHLNTEMFIMRWDSFEGQLLGKVMYSGVITEKEGLALAFFSIAQKNSFDSRFSHMGIGDLLVTVLLPPFSF